MNNSKFGDYASCIYPIELERKYITDTARSAPYLDLHLQIYSDIALWLTRRLLKQGFLVMKLKFLRLSDQHELVNRSKMHVSKMITDMFRLS